MCKREGRKGGRSALFSCVFYCVSYKVFRESLSQRPMSPTMGPAEISHWLGSAPRMLCGLSVNVVVGFRAQELINLCHCCGRLVTSILMATPTDKGRGKISIRSGPVLMATPMKIKIKEMLIIIRNLLYGRIWFLMTSDFIGNFRIIKNEPLYIRC